MPSFLVHSIVGSEVTKKLQLSEEEKIHFFIANLLPDTRQIERNPDWDEVELRRNIQKEKKITHFRTNQEGILEYPDLDFFLQQYGKYIENDIIVFGYFFHLYTDYYYFSTFFPKIVSFLDKDNLETNIKTEHINIKVKKDNHIVAKLNFWSKSNKEGLYQDYSRINKYLIDKYDFQYYNDLYKDCLKDDKFSLKIKEVKLEKANQLLDELQEFYEESKNSELEEFKIFKTEDVDNLINEIIEHFLDDYGYLLENYQKK